MQIDKLQTALDRAEKIDTMVAQVTLTELYRIDSTRSFRDQAEIDYWTDRLNRLEE